MIYYLIITIAINIGVLTVSLFFLRKNLHPLEILVYWLWVSTFQFLFKEIVDLNHEWIKVDLALPFIWSYTLDSLILIPCLTVWLVYVFFSKVLHPIHKGMMTLCWFTVLIGIQYVNRALGYVHFLNWNVVASFIQWFILLILILSFAICFRKLLKKEALIT